MKSREDASAMDDQAIYLKQLELGPMQNFVYLVGRPGDPPVRGEVDPAWEIDTIVRTVAADDMTLIGALVTHTHQDHVGAAWSRGACPGRIPGVEDCSVRSRPRSTSTRPSVSSRRPRLGPGARGQPRHAGRRTTAVDVHAHPGHTPGSQCFLVDGRLISGDTSSSARAVAPICRAATRARCTTR